MSLKTKRVPKPTKMQTAINELCYLGGRLATDVRDASLIDPEHWNLPAVQQLLTEWDTAVNKARKLQFSNLTDN